VVNFSSLSAFSHSWRHCAGRCILQDILHDHPITLADLLEDLALQLLALDILLVALVGVLVVLFAAILSASAAIAADVRRPSAKRCCAIYHHSFIASSHAEVSW